MTDIFSAYNSGLESPATHLVSVTPDDDNDLPAASRGINVAQTGSLRVTTVGDTTETVHIAAGVAFPLRVKRVWQSGTTATGIVVLY